MSKSEENIKQVLVIRRDLNCRRGKEGAQLAHASMAFLIHKIRAVADGFWPTSYDDPPSIYDILNLSYDERQWVRGELTKKVVLQAKDLTELQEVEKLCKEAGLTAYLITDLGLTEFTEPTVTALGIGPDKAEMIDAITGPTGKHPLKLY